MAPPIEMAQPVEMAQRFRTGFLIHDVSRLRNTAFDQCMKPLGIRRAQWWILVNLSRWGSTGAPQTELARTLNIGKVALGRSIDCLEREGFVFKVADPHDRRTKHCVITPRGHDLLRTMVAMAKVINTTVSVGLSEDTERVLYEALTTMKANLTRMDVMAIVASVPMKVRGDSRRK